MLVRVLLCIAIDNALSINKNFHNLSLLQSKTCNSPVPAKSGLVLGNVSVPNIFRLIEFKANLKQWSQQRWAKCFCVVARSSFQRAKPPPSRPESSRRWRCFLQKRCYINICRESHTAKRQFEFRKLQTAS